MYIYININTIKNESWHCLSAKEMAYAYDFVLCLWYNKTALKRKDKRKLLKEYPLVTAFEPRRIII